MQIVHGSKDNTLLVQYCIYGLWSGFRVTASQSHRPRHGTWKPVSHPDPARCLPPAECRVLLAKVFSTGVSSVTLCYHAAMHHACLFGCAAGCNASQQRHYHCSSSSYFPSFPYVRALRAGTEAGGCTPLTCGQLLAPIWEDPFMVGCYACAASQEYCAGT